MPSLFSQLQKDSGVEQQDLSVQNRNAFQEALHVAGLPGSAVLNLLSGRGESAARNIADIGGKVLDILPGDYIPDMSRRQDIMTGSRAIGLSSDAPGYQKLAADIGVGMAADPLSYVTAGGSALSKLGKAAKAVTRAQKAGAIGIDFRKGAREVLESGLSSRGKELSAADGGAWLDDAVRAASETDDPAQALMQLVKDNPAFEQGGLKFMGKQIVSEEAIGKVIPKPVKEAAQWVGDKTAKAQSEFRSIFNWLREPAQARHMRMQSLAAGARATDVWIDKATDLFKGMTPDQRVAFGEAANNIMRTDDVFKPLTQQEDMYVPFVDQAANEARLLERIKAHPGLQDLGEEGAEKLAKGWSSLTKNMYNEEIAKGALYSPEMYMRTGQSGVPEMEYAADLARRYKDESGSVSKSLDRILNKLDDAEKVLDRQALAGKTDEIADRVDDMQDIEQALREWAEYNEGFQEWIAKQGFELRPVPETMSPADYFPRQFSIETRGAAGGGSSRAQFGKARSLKTTASLVEFMNRPGVELERDALTAIAQRSEQSGKAIARAQFARKVLGDETAALGKNTTTLVNDIVKNLQESDPDLAKIIDSTVKGMPPRGTFTNWLASANRIFKPAAIYGIFVPRFGGIFRNRIGAEWQKFSMGLSSAVTDPRKLADVGRDYLTAFSDAMVDSYGLSISKSRLGKALQQYDDAVKAATTPDEVLAILKQKHPGVAEAVESGVLNTFISSEELLKSIGEFKGGIAGMVGKAGKKILGEKGVKKLFDYMDMSGKAFQNSESYVRLATFLDLRKQGISPQRAADIIQETFLDYSVPTVGNRTARDIIPFFAFLSQTLPQQAKALAKRPAIAVGLNPVYNREDGDEEVLSWIRDQANIPIGRDEKGNLQFLVGAGLPVETLGHIPNIGGNPMAMGREIERTIIGSSQPLLKTAYSLFSGRDPFFGSQYGGYDKTPEALQALGVEERSELGRAYNIAAGTGIPQVLTTPAGMLNRLMDDRLSTADKMLNLLTGARVASNDAERARIQSIQQAIERDPQVARFVQFVGDDPRVKELNKLLRDKRKEAKAKKKLKDQSFISR